MRYSLAVFTCGILKSESFILDNELTKDGKKGFEICLMELHFVTNTIHVFEATIIFSTCMACHVIYHQAYMARDMYITSVVGLYSMLRQVLCISPVL